MFKIKSEKPKHRIRGLVLLTIGENCICDAVADVGNLFSSTMLTYWKDGFKIGPIIEQSIDKKQNQLLNKKNQCVASQFLKIYHRQVTTTWHWAQGSTHQQVIRDMPYRSTFLKTSQCTTHFFYRLMRNTCPKTCISHFFYISLHYRKQIHQDAQTLEVVLSIR